MQIAEARFSPLLSHSNVRYRLARYASFWSLFDCSLTIVIIGAVPLLHEQEKLKLGIEMQYSNHTDHDTRSRPVQLFEIGPSLAFRPTRHTRIDLGIWKDAGIARNPSGL